MKVQTLLILFLLTTIILPSISLSQPKDSIYYRKENAPGVKKILIDGKFWVWTQKIGDGKINVLLLHGGPAQSHEYFEIFAKYLPPQGITIYFYDQFGSYFSQTPTTAQLNDTSIWKVQRYVDEIEQVRRGLHLDKFFVYGHSYGALLALAYTCKYQEHVKGLIFSDMNPYQAALGKNVDVSNHKTDSIMELNPQYHVLMENKQKGLRYDTALYQVGFNQTFTRNFLVRLDTLPPELERTKAHKNFDVAQRIGPSTFSPDYAQMMPKITVPVLLISAKYDFIITPKELEALSLKFKNAQYFVVPDGGHIGFVDDPNDYFPGLIAFIKAH
jgi:proline iminopeptidase